MGAKARAEMAAARASLNARYEKHLGPVAPPCKVCGQPSTGIVDVSGRPIGPVCLPLKCAALIIGNADFSAAGFTKHPPGKYRKEGI